MKPFCIIPGLHNLQSKHVWSVCKLYEQKMIYSKLAISIMLYLFWTGTLWYLTESKVWTCAELENWTIFGSNLKLYLDTQVKDKNFAWLFSWCKYKSNAKLDRMLFGSNPELSLSWIFSVCASHLTFLILEHSTFSFAFCFYLYFSSYW